MPLPKLPSKPATILLAKDYPKATGPRPVPAALAAVPEAAPAPKKAAPVKAVPVAKTSKAAAPAAAPIAPAAPAAPAVARAAKASKAKQPAVLQATPEPVAKSKPSVRGKVTPIVAEAPHPAKHKAQEVAIKSSTSRQADQSGTTKLFVLDTNVLMHDPSSLFRFEEHDVYLPMMTLEELDYHKKGMTEVARNARQVSRRLDALVSYTDDDAIEKGIPLSKLGNKDAKGRLYFQTRLQSADLPAGLPVGKADNQILAVVRSLEAEQEGRAVVLVSKDINMRIKARALGLPAEDYFNDHVLEDTDLLYSGIVQLPDDFWNKHGKDLESWQENKGGQGTTF
ncbi:MAG: PIN domain-containing protein [Sphingomonadaceae bacterium]